MRIAGALLFVTGFALAFACSAAGASLYEFTGASGHNSLVVSTTWTHAQAFDVTGSPTVSEIQLAISRWKGSTGSVYMMLCPDSNGSPGAPTATVAKACNTISETPSWVPFQWSGSALWSGRWWIVCEVTSSSDAEIDWASSATEAYGTGADTKTSFDAGSTWTVIQASDVCFKVFGAKTTVNTTTTVTATPTAVVAGGRSSIEVAVRDSGGNLVEGPGQVNMTASAGSLGSSQLTLSGGKATTTWDSPVAVNSYTITGSYIGHLYGGSDYQASSGNATVATSTQNRTTTTSQSLSSSSITTRQQITTTVTVKDSLNNPVTVGNVVFSCPGGTLGASSVALNGAGQASTTWTASNTTGSFSISAAYSGGTSGAIIYAASSDADTVSVDYTNVATITTVDVSPGYPYINGKSWVAVTVKDAGGVARPGQVTLVAPASGYYDSTTLSLASGKCSTIWHASSTTGDVLVTANYPQTIGNGNRYLASTGNATIHCVKDPDASGSTLKTMTAWVTDYAWWQLLLSDLDNTDDDAHGLRDKLNNFGFTNDDYGNDSNKQINFKMSLLGGREEDYFDSHDFIFYSGHGSGSGITFNNLNDSTWLLNFQAAGSWGNKDAEWCVFSACETMKDADCWAADFNGMHLLCGFTTTEDDTADLGKSMAAFMTKESLDDEPHRVAQSFFLACDECLDNSHKMKVIGENSTMFDDYLWGQGHVAADPAVDAWYSEISARADTNDPPTAHAGGPYNGTAGIPVTLDASASWDPDKDDTLTYVWDLDTGTNTDNGDYDNDGNGAEADDDSDTTGRHATHTFANPGVYNIRLIVRDSQWQVSTDSTTVTIAAAGGMKSTAKPLASGDELEIVDNFDPAQLPPEVQLPVFDTIGTGIGYDEMQHLAAYYGITGTATIDDRGNWNMHSGSIDLTVNSNTGAIMYIDRDMAYTYTHVPGPLPPRSTCIAAAEAFLNTNGIVRGGAVLDGFTDIALGSNQANGRALDSRIPFQRCVDYRRTFSVGLNTYLAVGPGGKLRVMLDEYEDSRNAIKVWREVTTGAMIPLVGAAQAVSDFHTLAGRALYEGTRLPPCRRIEINNVSIGYYERNFVTPQSTIYPVYVLDCVMEDDTSSYQGRLFLPAGWHPIEAKITAPADGAEYQYGDTITLKGSAAGGTEPYTYTWTSDRDGSLGGGETLPVSTLSVENTEGAATYHLILLTVCDSQGRCGHAGISLKIKPTPTRTAKTSGNTTKVSLLGQVVTASFPDYIYIEEEDRSSGICVVTNTQPPENSLVQVTGVMDTSYEERCIVASAVDAYSTHDPIKPLGMTVQYLGGVDIGVPPLGQKGVINGYGPNNIGLLVTVPGRVDWIASGGTPRFTVTDGRERTYVLPRQASDIPPLNSIVSVTGPSSIGYLGPGVLWRLVLPRDKDDIVTYYP